MVELASITWQTLLFLAFVLTGMRYLRDRNLERRDVFLMFGTLVPVAVSSWVEWVAGHEIAALERLEMFLLLAHPLAMLHVVDHLRPVPRSSLTLTSAGLGAGWLALGIFPADPRPALLTLAVGSYLVLGEAYATYRLVRGFRRTTSLVRRRLQLAAGGTLSAALAVLVGIFPETVPFTVPSLDPLTDVFAAIGIGAYFLAFVPPRRFERIWEAETAFRFLDEPSPASLDERVDEAADRYVGICAGMVGANAHVLHLSRAEGPDTRVDGLPRGAEVSPDEDGSLTAEASRSQEVIIDRDPSIDGAWEHRIANALGAESVLVIPLVTGDETRGWLLLFAPRSPLFLNEAASVMELLGEQMATLVETETLAVEREERKVLEAENEALEEANELKREFLASTSHEIRTPMNAVIGTADLLAATDLDEEQHEHLNVIRESGEHLMTIIDDILDMSKIEAGEFEIEEGPVDVRQLADICQTMVAEKAAAKDLDLSSSVDPDVPQTIEADGDRVRQIVSNLLSNAVKFTDEGSVELRVDSKGTEDDLLVAFSVEDTGPGIPPEDQETIFETFHQAQIGDLQEGLGLGLAVSQRLAELMGATIELDSEPGRGSTFTLRLPTRGVPPDDEGTEAEDVFGPHAPPALDASLPDEEGTSVGRVLLVEDDAVNRRVALGMLDELGVEAQAAVSGSAALDRLRSDDFDLVLLDVRMPGMDGFTVAERVREELPPSRQPRIVAMSAHAEDEYRRRASQSGMDAYLTKPIELADLAAEIQGSKGPIGDGERSVEGEGAAR